MTVASGTYNATWYGMSLGSNVQGYEMSYSFRARPLTSDATGQTVIDMIHAGQSMFVDFVLRDYDADAMVGADGSGPSSGGGLPGIAWWANRVPGVANTAGGSLWRKAGPLLLTPCVPLANPNITVTVDGLGADKDPPPYRTLPTRVFLKALLSPDFDVRILFSHRERYIPMRMVIFPVRMQQQGSDSWAQPVYTFNDEGEYAAPPSGIIRQASSCGDMGYYIDT